VKEDSTQRGSSSQTSFSFIRFEKRVCDVHAGPHRFNFFFAVCVFLTGSV
jgi:hypothetical protein